MQPQMRGKMTRTALKSLMLGAILSTAALSASPLMAQNVENGIYRQEVTADKAFPLLKGFLGLPHAERDAINLNYVIRIKNGSPSDAQILLKHGGQTQELKVLSDGRISPLPTLAQIRSGARVEVSGPETLSVAMRLRVYSTATPAKTMETAPLVKAVDQTNRVARKVGGVLALALPRQDRVFFEGAGEGTVTLADGSTQALPKTPKPDMVPAGSPYFVPSAFKNATSLSFTNTPKRILIGDAVK